MEHPKHAGPVSHVLGLGFLAQERKGEGSMMVRLYKLPDRSLRDGQDVTIDFSSSPFLQSLDFASSWLWYLGHTQESVWGDCHSPRLMANMHPLGSVRPVSPL